MTETLQDINQATGALPKRGRRKRYALSSLVESYNSCLTSEQRDIVAEALIDRSQVIIASRASRISSFTNVDVQELESEVNYYLLELLRDKDQASKPLHMSGLYGGIDLVLMRAAEDEMIHVLRNERLDEHERAPLDIMLSGLASSLDWEELDVYISRLLTPMEGKVLRLRYGFETGIPKTLEQVGEIMNLTRVRIMQIEHDIFRRIRSNILNFDIPTSDNKEPYFFGYVYATSIQRVFRHWYGYEIYKETGSSLWYSHPEGYLVRMADKLDQQLQDSLGTDLSLLTYGFKYDPVKLCSFVLRACDLRINASERSKEELFNKYSQETQEVIDAKIADKKTHGYV